MALFFFYYKIGEDNNSCPQAKCAAKAEPCDPAVTLVSRRRWLLESHLKVKNYQLGFDSNLVIQGPSFM